MKSFKQLLKKLASFDIVKVFSLNAVATLIKMLTSMISVKVVAAIIGPAGVALLGQLNNFSSIVQGVANGGIGSGVTKYVAEYKDEEPKLKRITSNAFRITVACSIAVALMLILGASSISKLIMMSDEYWYVFVVFGFTIIFYTLNALLVNILNGFKHFRKYVQVNICGTILGLVFSIALVVPFGIPGALINAVTFQSVMFFVTLWMIRKEPWLKKEFFIGDADWKVVRMFLGFSAMTLFNLALLPVSQMLLRGYVISEISIEEAGWWEGVNRISNMYLNVITTSLAVYVLPRFSEIQDKWELRKEIRRNYLFLVPLLLCANFSIYLLRHFIVWLLYTPDFYPMENLFGWQMAGDFFKISSWLLAYQMVAKAQTKLFIITELSFSLSYIVLSFVFLQTNGIVGLTQGYMVNYILYLLAMIVIYRKLIFMKRPENLRV